MLAVSTVGVLCGPSLIVVHIVVHVVGLAAHPPLHGVLLVVLVEQLHEDLVVVVEALSFDLLSPRVVVLLHVVKNSIHKDPDVWVFVRQKFKHNAHHLSLVQHDLSGGTKEQELKEGV